MARCAANTATLSADSPFGCSTIDAWRPCHGSPRFGISRLAGLAVGDVWVFIVSVLATTRELVTRFNLFALAALFVCLAGESLNVFPHVSGLSWQEFQVGNVVVEFVAVFVVNDFRSLKSSPKVFFHYCSVLKNSAVAVVDVPITEWTNVPSPVRCFCTATTFVRAFDGAEFPIPLLTNLERYTAPLAHKPIHCNHANSPFSALYTGVA